MNEAEQLRKALQEAEAKFQRIREIKERGAIRYSRAQGEPDPTPPFATHVELSMRGWDELEKELTK